MIEIYIYSMLPRINGAIAHYDKSECSEPICPITEQLFAQMMGWA